MSSNGDQLGTMEQEELQEHQEELPLHQEILSTRKRVSEPIDLHKIITDRVRKIKNSINNEGDMTLRKGQVEELRTLPSSYFILYRAAIDYAFEYTEAEFEVINKYNDLMSRKYKEVFNPQPTPSDLYEEVYNRL